MKTVKESNPCGENIFELTEEELEQVTGGVQNSPNESMSGQTPEEIPGAEGKYAYPTYSPPEKQIKMEETPKEFFP